MVINQANLFFIFVLNGIVIGLLFDFFRILRRIFENKDFLIYIEDILFWILTGFIILYSIFVFNNGQIRLFMFLGIIIGAIIYFLTLSKYIIKVNVAILMFIKKILYKAFKILIIPFQIIYKIIKKLFHKPIRFCIINLRNFSTKIFKNRIGKIKITKKDVKF